MVFVSASFIFIIVFLVFILHHAFTKKELKETSKSFIVTGFIFSLTWGVIYYFLFK